MYQYAYVYKLSIISSSMEIYKDIRIFASPLYPHYQELITNLLLLLLKKVRGAIIRGGGGRV